MVYTEIELVNALSWAFQHSHTHTHTHGCKYTKQQKSNGFIERNIVNEIDET